MAALKTCTGQCKRRKREGKFRLRKKKGSDEYYRMGECVECERDKRLKFYSENRERENSRSRAWAKNNRKSLNAYSRQWRKDHPEKVKKRRQKYYKKNRVTILSQQRVSNKRYIDKIKNSLEDIYVIRILRQRTAISGGAIKSVPGLIEITRERIKLHRALKKIKK